MKKGIDVSSWQGNIDWVKVKSNIDFAILRGGYSFDAVDSQFHRNAKECTRLGIPFGVYWFSYALNDNEAQKEADFCCQTIAPYKLDYPVCYDWEYDSDNYASKMGVNITNNKRASFAKTFLSRVENKGYYAMLYTNYDYLNKGFSQLTQLYDIWWAQWGVTSASKPYGIWQCADNWHIAGISGNVDGNITNNDYPDIIKNMGKSGSKIYTLTDVIKTNTFKAMTTDWWNKYNMVANDVILGKYGDGDKRKEALKKAGYDYYIVQAIVNQYVG